MAVIVYGIANCDNVKKVRGWLDLQHVAYTFHDYKKHGVPQIELTRWVAANGWEIVLNRKGTTWRALDESVRASVTDEASAIAVMRVHASTIKRPVVTHRDVMVVGVDFAALSAFSPNG